MIGNCLHDHKPVKLGPWRLERRLIYVILGLMLLSNIFAGNIGEYISLGVLLTYVVFLLTYVVSKRGLQKSMIFYIFIVILFVSVNLCKLNSLRGLTVIGAYIGTSAVFILCANTSWDKILLRTVSMMFSLYIIIQSLIWMINGCPLGFKSNFENPNALAAIVGNMIYFPALWIVVTHGRNKHIQYIIMFLGFLVCCSTLSRSIVLSLIIAYIVVLLWQVITYKHWIYMTIIVVYMCVLLFITVSYADLGNYVGVGKIDQMIFNISHKNILSGRQKFWGALIEIIFSGPIFGYGPGATPSDFINSNLSTHNLYIQTGLQTGIIGITILITQVIWIWHLLWQGRRNKIVRLSAAFMVGILFHQTFEVSLTQNNLKIGLLQWFIIALGVGFSLYCPLERLKTGELHG